MNSTRISISLLVWIVCLVSGCDRVPGLSKGTGDSGGGNSYQGRPLESYVRDPQSIPSFQDKVSPVLAALKANHQDLYRMFMTMLTRKTWYFVPGPLNQLPAKKIGSVVPTDQVALQDFETVWIDTNIFDPMKYEDQAILFVHEILMGIRILRFESMKNQCLAFAPQAELCIGGREERLGVPSDLVESDYNDIRKTVPDIFNNYANYSHEAWNELMFQRGFSTDNIDFPTSQTKKQINLVDLEKMLTTSKIISHWPTKGFNMRNLLVGLPTPPADLTSDEFCSLDFGFNGNVISYNLMLGGTKLQFATQYEDIVFSRFEKSYGKRLWVTSTPFRKNTQEKLGDRRYEVYFYFSSADYLQHVEVVEMACTEVDPGGSCRRHTTPLDGLFHFCSVDTQLKIN